MGEILDFYEKKKDSTGEGNNRAEAGGVQLGNGERWRWAWRCWVWSGRQGCIGMGAGRQDRHVSTCNRSQLKHWGKWNGCTGAGEGDNLKSLPRSKWGMHVCTRSGSSRVWLFCDTGCSPGSSVIGFSDRNTGVDCMPSSRDLPHPGIKPMSLTPLVGRKGSLPQCHLASPRER